MRHLTLAAIALLATALAARADIRPVQPVAAVDVTIQGDVVDGSTPLEGIEVEVSAVDGPVRAVTDAQGRFRVQVRVLPGEVGIRARVPGGGTVRERLQVTPAQANTTITFRLQLAGRTAPAGSELPRASRPPAGDEPLPPPPPPPSPSAPPEPRPSGRLGRMKSAAKKTAVSKELVTIPVYYATDRNRVGFTPLAYDGARDPEGQLHLGRFEVSVPRDHRLGQVERPTWRTLWREDPNLHFIITARTELPYDRFYGDVRAHVARSPRREALVFIHGYNVGFEDAVYRTAQITYDLEFEGAPILYSWPSEGRLASYPVDLNNNEWTTDHLRWFLQDVADKSGADVVHVIAHSMGNRALMNAMTTLVRERPDIRKRFAEVMLTAPDIDADVFLRLAASVAQAARRVTLYASANDTALLASRTYQGYRRAGDSSQGVLTCPHVDTVDVSALKTDFLGHSYVSDHRSVVSDISELLRNGSPPERRFGLRAVGEPPQRYWLFRP